MQNIYILTGRHIVDSYEFGMICFFLCLNILSFQSNKLKSDKGLVMHVRGKPSRFQDLLHSYCKSYIDYSDPALTTLLDSKMKVLKTIQVNEELYRIHKMD